MQTQQTQQTQTIPTALVLDVPTLPHRIDVVLGGSDDDRYGTRGEYRLRVTLLYWPGRGEGAWTWYCESLRAAHRLIRSLSRIDAAGKCGEAVGDHRDFELAREAAS